MEISKNPIKSVQDKIRRAKDPMGSKAKCSCGKMGCNCGKKMSSLFGKKAY